MKWQEETKREKKIQKQTKPDKNSSILRNTKLNLVQFSWVGKKDMIRHEETYGNIKRHGEIWKKPSVEKLSKLDAIPKSS